MTVRMELITQYRTYFQQEKLFFFFFLFGNFKMGGNNNKAGECLSYNTKTIHAVFFTYLWSLPQF